MLLQASTAQPRQGLGLIPSCIAAMTWTKAPPMLLTTPSPPLAAAWFQVTSSDSEVFYHNKALNVSQYNLTEEQQAQLLPPLDPYNTPLYMPLTEFIEHPIAQDLLHDGIFFQVGARRGPGLHGVKGSVTNDDTVLQRHPHLQPHLHPHTAMLTSPCPRHPTLAGPWHYQLLPLVASGQPAHLQLAVAQRVQQPAGLCPAPCAALHPCGHY